MRWFRASSLGNQVLSSPWWNPASYRERRGARLTRREEGAYWAYATDEQRRQAGCIAARMQRGLSPRAVRSLGIPVPSNQTAVSTPAYPGVSHRTESPLVLPPYRVFTRDGSERPEPVIGVGGKPFDDQWKGVSPEPNDSLIAWMHYALRKHRQVSRPGFPLVRMLFEASPQLRSVPGAGRIVDIFRSVAPPHPHGRRCSQRSETIPQPALSCFVESKFFFFNLAHPFSDVVQERLRLRFQRFSGAGDLTHRFQDPLDVPGLHGGGSVYYVPDELLAIDLVGGGAQGAGKLRSLLLLEPGQESERRPLVPGYERHSPGR